MSLRGIELIKTNEYINSEDEQDLKTEISSEIGGKQNVEITKYEDDGVKCGDIFVSNSGEIHFACSFCDNIFKAFKYFKNHIKQHLLVKEEELYDDTEEPSSHTLFEDGDDNASDDLEGNYKIIDVENASVSDMDEDPLKADPVAEANLTSDNEDYIEQIDIKPTDFIQEDIANPDLYCEMCHKQLATNEMISEDDSDDDEFKTKTSVKTIKCRDCSNKFKDKTKRVYDTHLNTAENPLKCNVCGKYFRLKHLLVGHMRTHTGERPFSCPECPAKFTNRSNRNVHVRAHLGIKRFGCEVCGKRFVRNVDKKIHVRTHTGEKPYQCETCGTSFMKSSQLFEHNKRHTNTKPYQCEICFKSFYSKALLKNHQTTHSDERPFECNQCDARFPLKRTLRCHMKIHSAVKAYICNVCGKAFSQNSGLYCHMKTHGYKLGVKTDELDRGVLD